jgi:hypothetical protein
VEFDVRDGLPKGRVGSWSTFAAGRYGAAWADPLKAAAQYYLNSHTGPTGQIEVEFNGFSVVVGSVLGPGETAPSVTSLATGGYAAAAALSGEWGKLPLAQVAEALDELTASLPGRSAPLAPILFGMPGQFLFAQSAPARARGHALAAGNAVVLAHTGVAVGSTLSAPERSAAQALARVLFRQALQSALGSDCGVALLTDSTLFAAVATLPEYATASAALAQVCDAGAKTALAPVVNAAGSAALPLRGVALYALSEVRRAQRAGELIRKGDAEGLAAVLNVAQVADASVWYQLSDGGLIEDQGAFPSLAGAHELDTLALHGDPLWKQTGTSGLGSSETDLLCELAQDLVGVLGARRVSETTVAVLCKKDNIRILIDRLVTGYYLPRQLPSTLIGQVHLCRGVSVVETT